MAKINRIVPALRHLSGVVALVIACGMYVAATERYDTERHSTPEDTHPRLTRSYRLQVSRLHARLRAMKAHPIDTSGERCFATTESEARDKLIQRISEIDPSGWDPTLDYSTLLPSASSYVCTEGLQQEELNGIAAALNTNTRIKPQLYVHANVENAPESEVGHAIIQEYLGRDRYLAHMSNCFDRKRSGALIANVQLDRMVTALLHLSEEQQRALKPLQDKLRAINSYSGVQTLDEQGALISLDNRPQIDIPKELEELLSLAEAGFAILSEEQARAYRELVTGSSSAEVISQFKLTESFLPIPEEVREMIKSNNEIVRANQQEAAQLGRTPVPED